MATFEPDIVRYLLMLALLPSLLSLVLSLFVNVVSMGGQREEGQAGQTTAVA